MPDENTNPVGTTQTSQNDQAVTNQTGDDFVLDFGGKESEESIGAVEVELEDDTNGGGEDIQDSRDLDFGDGSMDDEEGYSGDNKNDASIQEENMGDDMNIDIPPKDNKDYANAQEESMGDDMDIDISPKDNKDNTDIQEESMGDDMNIDIPPKDNKDYAGVQEVNVDDDVDIDDNSSDTSYEIDEEAGGENEGRMEIENKEESEDTEYGDVNNSLNQQDFENKTTLENDEENQDTDLSYSEDISIDKNDVIDNNDEINEDYVEVESGKIADETEGSEMLPEIDLDTNQSNNDEKVEYSEKKEEDQNVGIFSQEPTDYTEDSDTELTEDWEDASKNLKEGSIFEKSDNEEMLDNYEDGSSQEKNSLDDMEETSEDNQNKATIFGSSDDAFLDTNSETDEGNRESIFQEDSLDKGEENKDIDVNINNSESEEASTQTENTDFLGNTSANSEGTNIEDDVDTNITNFELDVDSTDKQENPNVMLDNNVGEDDNAGAVQENNMENNQEDISFTLDYQEGDKQDDNSNHIILDNNSTGNNNEQSGNEEKEIDINSTSGITSSYDNTGNTVIEPETSKTEGAAWNQNATESVNIDKGFVNQAESHQITSTLSLDQILDSELNDNPQFADNSQTVPRNVPINSGSLVKKVVGIFAGIGVFALAGYFLLIRSPNIDTDTQQGSTEVVEDLDETTDHFSSSEDEGEPTEENTSDPDFHPAKSIIEQESIEEEFGEEELGEEILNNSNPEELNPGTPEPYVCEDEYCIEEPEFPEIETTPEHQPGDVLQVISEYKQEAERYYTEGDEMQDKKLVKYSLQVIHQCDVYQEQVEKGEGLDDESFSSFTSKIEGLFAKIEEYRAGNSIEDENYNFEGKEEVKDFIENRDNYWY